MASGGVGCSVMNDSQCSTQLCISLNFIHSAQVFIFKLVFHTPIRSTMYTFSFIKDC